MQVLLGVLKGVSLYLCESLFRQKHNTIRAYKFQIQVSFARKLISMFYGNFLLSTNRGEGGREQPPAQPQ